MKGVRPDVCANIRSAITTLLWPEVKFPWVSFCMLGARKAPPDDIPVCWYLFPSSRDSVCHISFICIVFTSLIHLSREMTSQIEQKSLPGNDHSLEQVVRECGADRSPTNADRDDIHSYEYLEGLRFWLVTTSYVIYLLSQG